jgi:tetratricopeptide (TPR) repeat protein
MARLGDCLDLALAGKGTVFFVCGEAGSGKTALMSEFAHRAMETYPDLLVASGECAAYLGFGDPYLPIRSILAVLTGDLGTKWIGGASHLGHARRLWDAMPSATEALIDYGPQVLDLLLDKESLLARAFQAAQSGAPWLQRLRQWLDQPHHRSEHLDDSQLFQQTTNVLRDLSTVHPLLLIIDDLQWADKASVGLLFHLGRRLAGSRILLLAAYRPEEVELGHGGERHPLQKLVTEFRRIYGDISLELDQVDETKGRAFVDAFVDTEPNHLGEDFRSVLFQRTSGQPLFTIELLRTMQEQGGLVWDDTCCWTEGPDLDWERLPARVTGVIEERLDRLDRDLYEILTAACVEGEQFTLQVLARMLRLDEGSLLRNLSGQLVRRHRLVRWLGGMQVGEQRLVRFQFAHTLFQQYLYESLGPGERQLLHGEIAATLEDLYQGHTEAIAAQLARHYSEAGDDLQALRFLTLAADAALAAHASDEAEAGYRRAAELAGDSTLRAHLLEGLGRALARQSRFAEAIQTWRQTIELCRTWGAAEDIARLYARSSHAAWWDGSPTLGLQLCEEGLEATADAPESAGRARLLHEAARVNWLSGNPEQARLLCREALAMAKRLGAVEVQADALVTLGGLSVQAPEEALALLRRAAQLAEAANLPGVAFRAHNNLSAVYAWTHSPQAACNELERAIQLSRQTGNVAQEIFGHVNLIEGVLILGELDRARTGLFRMRQLASDLDDSGSSADRIRRAEATVRLHEGEWSTAIPLLQLCRDEARQQNDLQTLFSVNLLLGRTLLETCTLVPGPGSCDQNEAERVLAEAIEIGHTVGDADTRVWCQSYLAALYADQGRPEQAHDLLSEAQVLVVDWPFPAVEEALLWGEARVAAAKERWTEALSAFETLAETYTQGGMRWEQARILIDWAVTLASRGGAGDLDRARSLLQQSLTLFQQMGIPRYTNLVQERLSALPSQA